MIRKQASFGLLISFIFLISLFSVTIAEAAGAPVTITGNELKNKIKTEGSAIITNPNKVGWQTYRLTSATKDQVGAIWLDDRFSLADTFTMHGEIYIGKASNNSTDADGLGLIFHNDPTKKYGNRGGGLGIHNLRNATGLVFDTYKNGAGDAMTNWAPGQVAADPNTPYTQIWSTNDTGRTSRIDAHRTLGSSYLVNRWVPVEMSFINLGTTGILYFNYTYNGTVYQQHTQLDTSDGFINFSTLASTGMLFSSHYISIKEIKYVPYRSRELIYKDIETNAIINVPGNAPVTGAVNEDYVLEPQAPTNYDIVSIEGELSGIYELNEVISDKDVIVNVRRKSQKFTTTMPVNGILRKNQQTFNVTELGMTTSVSNKKVAGITVTMPEGVSLSQEKDLPSGWVRADQKLANQTLTQYVMIDGDSVNNTTNYFTPVQATNFIKGRIFEVGEGLASTDVKIEITVNDRPLIKRLSGENFEEVTYYEFSTNYNKEKKVAPIDFIQGNNQANAQTYRGLRGHLLATNDVNESNWLKGIIKQSTGTTFLTGGTNMQTSNGQKVTGDSTLLPNQIFNSGENGKVERYNTSNAENMPFYWVAGPIKGELVLNSALEFNLSQESQAAYLGINGDTWKNLNETNINRFIVEYQVTEGQGEDNIESSNTAQVSIPQEIEYIYKDTNNQLLTEPPVIQGTNYRIGSTMLTQAQIPRITNYTYKSVTPTGTSFPLRASERRQEITLIYQKNTADMSIRYFQLDGSGNKTERKVLENLEDKKRKEFDTKSVVVGSRISTSLPKIVDFEGYTSPKAYVVMSGETEIKNDIVPTTNFEVIYYYQPTESFIIPTSLDFGKRQESKNENTYGLLYSKEPKNNVIAVTNTYETDEGEPKWDILVSTDGFYAESNGVKLLANLSFKHEGHTKMIGTESTKLIETQSAFKSEIPLINQAESEGLFVIVAKVNELGKYRANLKIKLQRAP